MSEELEEGTVEGNEEVTEVNEEMPTKEEMLAAIAGEDLPEKVVEDLGEQVQYVDGFDPENPTEEQQQAMDKGWKPEGAEGKRTKSAEEYLDAAPLYERLHSSEKKVKDLEAGFEHMRQMNEAQVERAGEQAREELKRQMKEAVEVADTDRAMELAEELTKVDAPKEEPKSDTPEYDPAFTDFVAENTWYDPNSEDYDVDKAMYANQLGDAYGPLIKSGKKTVAEMLGEVNTKVKEKFKATNPKRNKAAPVASSTPASKGEVKKQGLKDLDLSQQEYRIVRNMINAGQMTEEEYMKDYIKAYG